MYNISWPTAQKACCSSFTHFEEQTMKDDRFQSWQSHKVPIIMLALVGSTSGLGKYFTYIISFNLDHKSVSTLTK